MLSIFLLSLSLGACVRPYTPRAYKYHKESDLYAIICHNGKRTIRIPAEDWPTYKAKGDYRGPCRPIGPAGGNKPKKHQQTAISYKGAKALWTWSAAQWDTAHPEAAVQDSTNRK